MRAKPIFTLSVIAGALLLPGTAAALGLGRLTVQSSIGQPLSAQIELTSAAKDELDSLVVKIADPSLYRQNNLAYNSVLARARVTLERNPAGQPYLKVVTSGAVSEPFLDLMVELNWASGRLVREYTFLLDPPGVVAPPVEPVAPARVGAAPPRPAAPAAPAAPATAPVGGTAGGSGGAAGDDYAVQRGDTLSKIAAQTKPSGATLEQMLVALFNTNQRAFDGGNINRLRAGSIVKIPSADAVVATAPTEAAQIVRLHASDWRGYRDRVAGTATTSDTTGSRSAGGRIGTSVVEAVPAAPPGRDQLKVSREAGPRKGVAGATEETVAREKQIKEAQQRIAELEKTLTELQRAVELKNQTMAQMQAKADAAKGQPAAVPPPKAPEMKVAESAKAEPPKTEPPKASEPLKATETPKAAEAPKAAETTPKPAEPPKAPEAKAAEAPKSPPPATAPAAAPPKPAPTILDDLMANTPTWAIGGGALAVLAGIAAIIAARRRKSTRFEDGIIADTDIKTNTVFGSTGGGVVNTGDNSLSSEFSREGLGSIDTDEVDPIAEAEVYLAYGRDAQAEEILKHALRKDPKRQEVYLKLLEIHAQHNKPSAFDSVAAELLAVSQGQGETWQKAVALGRQLDPENPMFAESPGTATLAAGAPLARDTQTFSVPPDLHSGNSAADAPTAQRSAKAGPDSMFDFRLDEDLSIMPRPEVQPKSPADILAGAESELERTAKSVAAGAAAGVARDRGSDSVSEKIEAARLGANLDFRLDELDKPVPADKTPASRPAAPLDLDKLDLSFDQGQPAFEDPTPSVLDGQWHDAATKLDLAKAYQEMGDVEGAREILQEVLREGDDQQKTEAQMLITKLG